MLKKINPIIIFSGSIFVFLLTTGIKRIYLSTQAEIYEALINGGSSDFSELTDLTPGELITRQYLWPLAFAFLAVSMVFLVNWRTNKSPINSFIVLLIAFSLFPTGVINGETIPIWFTSFCYLFSTRMAKAFLIGGSVLCITGIMVLDGGNKLSTRLTKGKTSQLET